MGIKRTYRGIPEPNLASYDFYDLATGTGYKNFYGADLSLSGASTYRLTTQTPYALVGSTSYYEVASDLDFDVTFEVPITLEGDCLVSVPITSGSNFTATLTLRFYKVDGVTETLIGEAMNASKALNNSSAIITWVYDMPLTHFKRGEKLRLNLIGSNPGGTKILIYLHDPKSRSLGAPATTISQLIVTLPIKL